MVFSFSVGSFFGVNIDIAPKFLQARVTVTVAGGEFVSGASA